MKHLICRIATVGLLALPLAFGAHDAYSAKRGVDRSDDVPAAKGSVDSPKAEKSPQKEPSKMDAPREFIPVTRAPSTTRTPRPSTAGEDTPFAPTTQSQQNAAAIENNWISINHGGATEVSAGNLRLGISIAQPVAGYVEAGNYQLGLGYWYGAAAGATSECDCPLQANLNGDAVRNITDLNLMINILFLNGDDVQDPTCPASRVDFNCDGTLNIVDFNFMASHLFLNGPLPCDPCNCTSYPSDCPTYP